MKKKIFSIAFMAAIALAAGLNVSQSKSEASLSDIALSNVEALAGNESGGACEKYCPNDGLECILVYSDGSRESCKGRHS